jgi:hypothetical protein
MPKGFQRGNKLAKNQGRKGYEFEEPQLKLIRKIVSKDLKLVEKIYAGKATEKDFKKLAALQVRVAKYLDKLHAQKTDLTSGGERIAPIIQISETFINDSDSIPKNNRT